MKDRYLKVLKRFVCVILPVTYATLCILLYSCQDHLLYAPSHEGHIKAKSYGLDPWPSEENFHGYQTRQNLPKIKRKQYQGTAFVWHGNGGEALHRSYFIDALGARGLKVILLEYPGYGDKTGEQSQESLVVDAKLAVEQGMKDFPAPYLFVAESMGCGVASQVISHFDEKVEALLLITPWDSLENLADSIFPYLPTSILLSDDWDSVEALSEFHGRCFVLVAGRDQVIPNKHSLRLYESLKIEKKLLTVNESGHNTWPSSVHEKWWDDALQFLLDNKEDN